MERESIQFHEAVRTGYLAQAKERPEQWVVLDATQSPEVLREQLVRELKARKLWPVS
jgi:thymidylate kinase